MKINKVKILAIILSAALMLCGCAAFLIVGSAPESVAIRAVSGAIADLADRNEIKPLLNALDEGSIELSAKDVKFKDKEIFDGASLSGKAYFSKNSFLLDDLEISYRQTSMSADLYFSEDSIYINESELFGVFVGINRGTSANDFKDSIFASDSNSRYALDEKTSNKLIAILESFDNSGNKRQKKDSEKVFEQYTKEFYKIVCDNAEFKSRFDKTELNGDVTKVRVVSMILDADTVTAIASDFHKFLCEDDRLPKLLEKYEKSFRPSFIKNGYDGDEPITELYEKLLDDLENKIDDIETEAKELLGEDNMVIEITTPRLSSKLLKISASVDNADNGVIFSFDFGARGVAKTDMMTLTVKNNTLVYELDGESDDIINASFTYNNNKVLTLFIDKSEQTYEILTHNEKVSIIGKLSSDKDSSTITLDEILYNNKPIITASVELIIKTKDEMPNVALNFDKIDEITEKEVRSWKKTLFDLGFPINIEDDAGDVNDDEYWTKDY